MSAQNKAVARRFYDAWNARDLDAFDELVAPDAQDHDPQNPFREMRGPAGAKRAAGMYHTAFSDGRIEIEDQIADGDLVTVGNGRGSCRLRAVLTDAVRPGVVVSPKGRWSKQSGGR